MTLKLKSQLYGDLIEQHRQVIQRGPVQIQWERYVQQGTGGYSASRQLMVDPASLVSKLLVVISDKNKPLYAYAYAMYLVAMIESQADPVLNLVSEELLANAKQVSEQVLKPLTEAGYLVGFNPDLGNDWIVVKAPHAEPLYVTGTVQPKQMAGFIPYCNLNTLAEQTERLHRVLSYDIVPTFRWSRWKLDDSPSITVTAFVGDERIACEHFSHTRNGYETGEHGYIKRKYEQTAHVPEGMEKAGSRFLSFFDQEWSPIYGKLDVVTRIEANAYDWDGNFLGQQVWTK